MPLYDRIMYRAIICRVRLCRIRGGDTGHLRCPRQKYILTPKGYALLNEMRKGS